MADVYLHAIPSYRAYEINIVNLIETTVLNLVKLSECMLDSILVQFWGNLKTVI